MAPLDFANGRNEVDIGTADALELILNRDSGDSNGLDQWFGTVINYSIAANGWGTAQSPGDQHPAVVYVISPTFFIALMPSSDAEAAVFQH